MEGNSRPEPNELMIMFIQGVNVLWPMVILMPNVNKRQFKKGL